MFQYVRIFAVVVIVMGAYLGIRYIGAVLHYACAVPEEDCPPPFRIIGDLGFVVTGGNLVPLWTRN
ncbi:MAG TPA: hypothetical protein VJK53_03315 [Candidatus Paceibacterota bacterium]